MCNDGVRVEEAAAILSAKDRVPLDTPVQSFEAPTTHPILPVCPFSLVMTVGPVSSSFIIVINPE